MPLAISSSVSALLLALGGCAQQPTFVPPSEEEADADVDADADTDTDTDTDTDADRDGDGFTEAEGDCDDDDIAVNPARDEDPDDGKDNDCDGRVDELWAGLTLARQYVWGPSDIVVMDTVSRITGTVTLDDGYAPTFVEPDPDGGWVFIHDPTPVTDPDYEEPLAETAALVAADETGACTVLAEFTPDETEDAYASGLEGLEDRPVVRGLVAWPDGGWLVARRGELDRVDPDGTVTALASWAWDWSDEEQPFELYAVDLAIDMQTREVGIFGFLGGFATWSEDGGFSLRRQADLSDDWKNWDWMLGTAGAALDGGGFYALMTDYQTGDVALYHFEDEDWQEVQAWTESLLQPEQLASNSDDGDFYVTANGGWYETVWLVRPDRGTVDDFYRSDADEGRFFRGVASNY